MDRLGVAALSIQPGCPISVDGPLYDPYTCKAALCADCRYMPPPTEPTQRKAETPMARRRHSRGEVRAQAERALRRAERMYPEHTDSYVRARAIDRTGKRPRWEVAYRACRGDRPEVRRLREADGCDTGYAVSDDECSEWDFWPNWPGDEPGSVCDDDGTLRDYVGQGNTWVCDGTAPATGTKEATQ